MRWVISSGGGPRRCAAAAALAALAASVVGCASQKQAAFPTPDAASSALVAAMSPFDEARMTELFGPTTAELVESGDPVQDEWNREWFVDKYHAKHAFVDDADGDKTLVVGDDDWPFPFPLVKESDGSWRWDMEAGRQEMLNRRIGNNELFTIQTCLAYADAQADYAMMDPTGSGVREYAQKFRSDDGKRDGLYWPTSGDEPPSPLGDLMAEATRRGYNFNQPGANGPRPYHGYLFRILLAQGADAPGGARSYVVNGHMIGGFALVAWPAAYGKSGVMTFMINQDGYVYEKDLGDQTDSLVRAMQAFDPGKGWSKVNDTPFVCPDAQAAAR